MVREVPGYFEVADANLYTVLHAVQNPVARVLLVGPFASERHSSYFTWVRWARYLAARKIEVLRFDYRGTGESTGDFEQQDMVDWCDDTLELARWFQQSSPAVPFVLHGFRLGALFAGIVFDRAIGDGLLLWSPPLSGQDALRSTLARWVRMKQLSTPAEQHLPFATCVQLLEEGQAVRVEGYRWSGKLWRSSQELRVPPGLMQSEGVSASDRPVRAQDPWNHITLLQKSGSPGSRELETLDLLFAENLRWITEALAAVPGHS